MGCFTTCFNNCKPSRHRRRRRSLKTHPSSLLHHLENYQSVDDFKVPELIQQEIEEIKEREGKGEEIEDIGEQEGKGEGEEKDGNAIDLSPDTKSDEKIGRKKVTFDLNVKFYENLTINDEEIEEIYEDWGIDDDDDDEDEEEEEEEIEDKQVNAKSSSSGFECECECASDSSPSSLFSYPVNHRYQNIRDSDDEFDDIVSSDESDIDDDFSDDDEINNDNVNDAADGEDDGVNAEEQSSESLFSLSIDSRKKKLGAFGSLKEVNSPIPTKNVDSGLNLMTVNNVPSNDSLARYDRVEIVDSVLNPVENLTQWKGMKFRSKLVSKNQPKDENFNSVQDFSFPVKKEKIEVDTSLSTWLVGAEEGTPKKSNSSVSVGNSHSESKKSEKVPPNKFEDRPILGALTLEEIREMSAGNTPRKCRSKSPDEKPIIGSVGSYWSHTGQATDSGGSTKSTKSRYRESAEIIWDATPFETRLEKALEKEANAEQVFTA